MNELTDEWIHAWVVWPCTDHWMNEQTDWHRHGFSLLETIFWFRVSFWCVVDLPLFTGFYTESPHITSRIYSTEETHFTWMNKKYKCTEYPNTLLENLWYLCLHTVIFFFSSSAVSDVADDGEGSCISCCCYSICTFVLFFYYKCLHIC